MPVPAIPDTTRSALEITDFPYCSDPLDYFNTLRAHPGAVLLDSGQPAAPSGRYDIMSADPLAMLEVSPGGEMHCDIDIPLHGSLFEVQRRVLEWLPEAAFSSDLPFLGGLIGYWSYDLARRMEPVEGRARDATGLPWSRVGLYDWALIQDHYQERTFLVATARRRRQVRAWFGHQTDKSTNFALAAPFTAEMSRQDYGERFQAVKRYIQQGDCYQINLTQRFSAPCEGDPWQAYLRLRHATPTPYAGYCAWEDKAVLSLSPERFLTCRNRQVEARPIKGTRPRGDTPQQDQALSEALLESLKDRAENVMIVDLLRNDLGRVCRPGSVEVTKLCGLESYANVHHLTSIIQGELGPTYHSLDLLAAAFPGGSITGAPKVRAMQIIDELEPSRRSLYCGSLGYVDIRGEMDLSIAIRTAVISCGRIHLWGGGGLVADSEENAEYRESLDKIRHLIKALETLEPSRQADTDSVG
ncbi:aminodeoxychorismate synthase component I [Pistricoccus aurantiacus]|uniref:aminodeoxychorismate synthase n=1 Tax=Pistricoccus aurantiacus TaxID=1883414 RepID=A0A5B8T017_9GAMM|nr:aminodeoxychorismate synthase component I [Pistricoccus aurantiacus]QEA40398.1 aminodeoxychorismate synthase component I [Pistricoccus aurantiacus]